MQEGPASPGWSGPLHLERHTKPMRIQKHLQRFADRHGLQVERYAIRGPRGKIFEAFGRLFYSQPDTGNHKFNRITQAKQAIEKIGLQYTARAEPVMKDRRALLVAMRREMKMTMQEFAEKYGLEDTRYFHSHYIHKSRRQAKCSGKWGFIFQGKKDQMTCSVTRSGIGGFKFDPSNPIEAATAVDAIGLDHWCIWRRYGWQVDWRGFGLEDGRPNLGVQDAPCSAEHLAWSRASTEDRERCPCDRRPGTTRTSSTRVRR